MRNKIIIGMSLLLSAIVPTAFAATATMNQPDNGFYEGSDPEWATLHSNDMFGTEEHRQYHRDAVQKHLQWHRDNSVENNASYENAHRLFHQERNEEHRLFHALPFGQ